MDDEVGLELGFVFGFGAGDGAGDIELDGALDLVLVDPVDDDAEVKLKLAEGKLPFQTLPVEFSISVAVGPELTIFTEAVPLAITLKAIVTTAWAPLIGVPDAQE